MVGLSDFLPLSSDHHSKAIPNHEFQIILLLQVIVVGMLTVIPIGCGLIWCYLKRKERDHKGTKSSDLKLRCRSIRFNKEEDSYIVSQESYGDPGLPHLTQSIALYGNSLDRSNIVINGFTLGNDNVVCSVSDFSIQFDLTLKAIADKIVEYEGLEKSLLMRAANLTSLDPNDRIFGKCGSVDTIADLFLRASQNLVWGWLDINPLICLLDNLEYEDITSILNDYITLLNKHIEDRLNIVKPEHRRALSQGDWIELKDESDHGNISLRVIIEHKKSLIEYFKVPQDAFAFYDAFEGCVTTCWYIKSERVASLIKKRLQEIYLQRGLPFEQQLPLIKFEGKKYIEGQKIEHSGTNAPQVLNDSISKEKMNDLEKENVTLCDEVNKLTASKIKLKDQLDKERESNVYLRSSNQSLLETVKELQEKEKTEISKGVQEDQTKTDVPLPKDCERDDPEQLAYRYVKDSPVYDRACPLGEGPYATVYKGTLRSQAVTIKEINRSQLIEITHERKFSITNFLKDSEDVISNIHHQNLVRFLGAYGSDTAHNVTMLVTESMGDTLEKYLAGNKGKVSIEKQLDICRQLTSGLQFLHDLKPHPIVHGNLVPGNVLADEVNRFFKITDYGLHEIRPPVRAYQAMKRKPSSLLYMPPEAFQEGGLTCESDIYSLGVTMLQIATQEPPQGLSQEPPQEVEYHSHHHLDQLEESHSLKQVIRQCLKEKSEERSKLGHTLESILTALMNLDEQDDAKNQFHSHLLEKETGLQSFTLPDMPEPRWGATALLLESKIYICGGHCSDRSSEKKLLVFSLKTGGWSILPEGPQYWCKAAVIKGKVTLLGGLRCFDSKVTDQLSTWTGEKWENVFPAMNIRRWKFCVHSYEDCIVASGGITGGGIELDSIEVLDIAKLQWSKAEVKLPTPLLYHKMAVCKEHTFIYHGPTGDMWSMSGQTFKSLLNSHQTDSRDSANEHSSWQLLKTAPHQWSELLASNAPVIIGGCKREGKPVAKVNLLNDLQWRECGKLAEERRDACSILLSNNSIIVFGGHNSTESLPPKTAGIKTVELINIFKPRD